MFIMMKRSTKRALLAIGIFLLGLLVMWGIKYRFQIPEIKGKTLLTYVPAQVDSGTVLGAAVGLRNPSELYKDLKETNFFRALNESIISNDPSEESAWIPEEKIILKNMGSQAVAAAYGNPKGEFYYLILCEIRDITGLKQRLYRHLRDEEFKVKEYAGEDIEKYSENIFYSIADGVFMAANSVELIENAIDLKKGRRRIENFNARYRWVEGQMDSGGDAYVFSAGEKVHDIFHKFYPPGMDFIRWSSANDVYREIYFDRGFTIHSYTPSPGEGSTTRAVASSLEAMPLGPVIMQADVETDFQAGAQLLINRNIIEPEFSPQVRNIADHLKGEAAIALINSPASGGTIPGILFFAEADKEAYEPARDFIRESFDISLNEGALGNIKYEYGRMPLFFTNIDITIAHMKIEGKYFMVLGSSRDIFEQAAAAAEGKNKGFSESESWKNIKKHLPERYSSVYYADIDSLVKSARPLLNFFGAQRRLTKFLAAEPFSWMGPAGGARITGEDFRNAYIHIPVQDLGKEEWIKLFSGTSDFFNN